MELISTSRIVAALNDFARGGECGTLSFFYLYFLRAPNVAARISPLRNSDRKYRLLDSGHFAVYRQY
ncbi:MULTISPECIES: hypothetical protein [unclassified Microcoleus]|uniref:hypothetical protein n=1 Tax=unclassified Microcoleus TaxID=2642155 RepID=UPI002FD04D11